MSVESIITRELDIRFIDARHMVAEAKMKMGIQGYPTEQQKAALKNEVIKIFRQCPLQEQVAMVRMSTELESLKQGIASSAFDGSSSEGNSGFEESTKNSEASASPKGTHHKKGRRMMWPLGRRRESDC